MGMTLSKVQAKERTVTVLWDGETVDVGYHPAAVTPALLDSVQAAAEANDLAVIGMMMEPMLAWWDVLDDDGQRLPTDAPTIRIIPLAFTLEVLKAVQAAMQPADAEGKDSGAG